MTPAILIGDSGAHGSGPGPLGRLDVTPYDVLRREQQCFDFIADYTRGGASFAGILSLNDLTRENNGMPGGMTFESLVTRTPAHGILISLGGNDNFQSPGALIDNIIRMAAIVRAAGKVCAFVGIPDISATQSFANTVGNRGAERVYIEAGAAIAYNAEVIRQTCAFNGFPYIDIRNAVTADQRDITVDVVHPNQRYSTAIWTHVARCLEAAY